MRTKIIVSMLLGILLIGIVAASFLTYFGKITGSVEVKAPEFYLDGSEPIADYLGLAINNEGISHDPVYFIGPESTFFISESLGIEFFYEAEWKIILSLRTEDNVSGQVDIELYTIEGEDPHFTKDNICTNSPPIIIPQLDDSDFHSYSITCEGSKLTDMEEPDMLVLRLSDGFNSIKYDIELNGNSRIEVTAT